MKIEKIERKEKNSLAAHVSLTILGLIQVILALLIIRYIWIMESSNKEIIITIGTLLGVSFIVFGIMFAILRKGYVADEIVTAIEE